MSGPPPPAPGPTAPTLTYRQRQQQQQQQQQALLQQARATAGGLFIQADLERLISIGGAGLLQPIAARGAPATVACNGVVRDVADMPIEQGTPEFWVRYLFDELTNDTSRHALSTFADRGPLLDFYNRVFYRPDNFDSVAKPFVVPKHQTVLAAYPAGNADLLLLRSHLRAALDLGFDWMQWPADASGTHTSSAAANVSYMMEIQQKTVHTPLVWRTEDRRTLRELRGTGFTQQVTVDARIQTLGMDQTWNPYSTDEVRGRLWYRRQNTDNCLYTGISVALHPFASLVFPKITLSPTSLAPVANAVLTALRTGHTVESALLQANGEVKPAFAPYVARLERPGQPARLCLYSRARTILMALEGKYLDTQGVQSHGAPDRSQAFPEYGSLGVSGENVFAQVELHRFFHDWSDDAGFTAFVNTASCEMVSRGAIVGCFAESKARTEYYAKVESTYNGLVNGGPYGLTWAAGGMGHNVVTPQFRDATVAWVDGQRINLR